MKILGMMQMDHGSQMKRKQIIRKKLLKMRAKRKNFENYCFDWDYNKI